MSSARISRLAAIVGTVGPQLGPDHAPVSPEHPRPPAAGARQEAARVVAAGLRERADRRRTAIDRVSAAYTTAYGHPTSRSGMGDALNSQSRRRRWAIDPKLAVVGVVAILVLGSLVAWWTLHGAAAPARPLGIASPSAVATGSPMLPTPAAEPDIVVHVVGEVTTPGLVTIPAGSRVADAVQAAGGVGPGADLSAVNLARSAVDGEQILIPVPGQVIPGSPAAQPGTPGSGAAGGLVDVNKADAAALDALPGIGPVLAERIVAWRTDNGPFASIEDLSAVSGIGPAVMDKIRDLVTA